MEPVLNVLNLTGTKKMLQAKEVNVSNVLKIAINVKTIPLVINVSIDTTDKPEQVNKNAILNATMDILLTAMEFAKDV
jgi:hypothetical protein